MAAFYLNMNCTFLDDNVIRIGDNALIAPNVQIYTAFHPTNAADRFGTPKEDGSFKFCKTQTAPEALSQRMCRITSLPTEIHAG